MQATLRRWQALALAPLCAATLEWCTPNLTHQLTPSPAHWPLLAGMRAPGICNQLPFIPSSLHTLTSSGGSLPSHKVPGFITTAPARVTAEPRTASSCAPATTGYAHTPVLHCCSAVAAVQVEVAVEVAVEFEVDVGVDVAVDDKSYRPSCISLMFQQTSCITISSDCYLPIYTSHMAANTQANESHNQQQYKQHAVR